MNKKSTKSIYFILMILLLFLTSFSGCSKEKIKEINIGYIGPLSVRATDLGIEPSNTMLLAIEIYNISRFKDEPKINLFIEDDKWEEENAVIAYQNLRKKHNVDVVFISNTDGTIAVSDKVLKDKVVLVNPLNNGELFGALNKNTFNIAKSTEEANGLIAIRLIELAHKKVVLFQYPNSFMAIAAKEVKRILEESNIEIEIIVTEKGNTNFKEELKRLQKENYDGYVFFGYKELGFAMKQARDMGITAPFFGSTVLLDPQFYENSEGEIVNTEFTYFTPADGNYVLASEFLKAYENKFNKKPYSVWPAMQAYDAMNILLSQLRTINKSKKEEEPFDDWLRKALYEVNYYQGVCGNIAITNNGTSKGIYFSLYNYESKDRPFVKVKR